MGGLIWRDNRLVEQDEHVLKRMDYFPNELHLMLKLAGFSDVELRAGLHGIRADGGHGRRRSIARRPGG
jgi:hypothetical protein